MKIKKLHLRANSVNEAGLTLHVLNSFQVHGTKNTIIQIHTFLVVGFIFLTLSTGSVGSVS